MTTPRTWPLLTLALPAAADDELQQTLGAAAIEAGALGTLLQPTGLVVYFAAIDNAPDDAAARAAAEPAFDAAESALRETCELLGQPWPGATRELLDDAPWATAWKVDFVTLPVGERLVVRPDWEQGTPLAPDLAGRAPIYIRPGSGFGTARHETTRLALILLEQALRPGMRVLDFGSGSGILALAACALGAAHVTAVECDPQANLNARENFKLNGCADRITLIEGERPLDTFAGAFDLVVCNMLPHETLPVLAGLAAALEQSDSRLISSGFLVDQNQQMLDAWAEQHLVPLTMTREGEWGGALLKLAGGVSKTL